MRVVIEGRCNGRLCVQIVWECCGVVVGVVYGWCVVREWLYCADLVGTRVDVSRSLWRPRPLLRRVIVLHLGC